MKAFRFRLDQARRWRATQLDLEKSRIAPLAKRLAEIRAVIAAFRLQLESAPSQLGPASDGAALMFMSVYMERTRRQIAELEKGAARAESDLNTQTQVVLEANRKLQLIEKLEESARAQWNAEFNRELEAFADDTFLGRLQSKKRARSSGG